MPANSTLIIPFAGSGLILGEETPNLSIRVLKTRNVLLKAAVACSLK